MRSDQHTTQFDELGSKYDEIYGKNQAQIDFIKKALTLLEQLGQKGQLRILDVGVGTGKPTSEMAAAAGMRVDGFDYSNTMIDLARKNVPSGRFEQAHHMDFNPKVVREDSDEELYDGIFAIFSTTALTKDEMTTFISERLGRWVKQGGYLFIGTFSLDSYPKDTDITDHDGETAKVPSKFFGITQKFLLWTEKGWRDLLSQGHFEIVEKYVVPFQPEADCDWEPHEYTIARRV